MCVPVSILGISAVKVGHPWGPMYGAKIVIVKQLSSQKE